MTANFVGEQIDRKDLVKIKQAKERNNITQVRPCQYRGLLNVFSPEKGQSHKYQSTKKGSKFSDQASVMSKRRGGATKSAQSQQHGEYDRKLDGKKIVKQANFYFTNHPTCLKNVSSDDTDEE